MGLEFNPGNDKVLSVVGLNRNGSTITTATVTYTLKGPTGATLTGGTGTLAHVSAGTYSGTVESTVTDLMTLGAKHTCTIVIVSGSYDAKSVEPFYPSDRVES